ncbi:hypothetical protein GCM10025867_30410 [Frondihabitans sucicola]|uniref:Uncharacterized protein n=1 Tax=Frondihabitans sucicola TaxID=1268041 RepID=A0ABN6Y0I5_9MICO|nr:hypothetical protein [Frondihabitans sucicola]BDZ50800.1 hypothetical protein GCM10025867_30410 [Frondihabitans sucicola]
MLPLNPELADRVLRAAVRRTGSTYATNDAHAKLDAFAAKSREVITTNLERAFKAM